MKKIGLILAFICASSAAYADLYVSAGMGLNVNSSEIKSGSDKFDYKDSAVYSGAIGYELPIAPFRFEVEGLYNNSKAKFSSEKMKTYALFANGYARVPVVGLYGGIGVGVGSVWDKAATLGQAMIGFEHGIGGINAAIEYRRIENFGEVKRYGDYKGEYKADVAMVKLRLSF